MALKHTVLHENATSLRQMQASDGRPYKTSVQYNTSIGVEQWEWNLRDENKMSNYSDNILWRGERCTGRWRRLWRSTRRGSRVSSRDTGSWITGSRVTRGAAPGSSWRNVLRIKKGASVRKQQHRPQGSLPLHRILGTNKWEAWVGIFCLHFIIRESGWADAIISIFLQMH